MKDLKLKTLVVTMITLITVSGVFAQNYKIKQTMSMNGQKMETTTYVKGPRKRTEGGGFMGMGGDVATVEQCDLKRDLKISDKKKMYAVEPFDDGSETPATTGSGQSKIQNPKSKIEKGGTVTYTSNISDTGERKQLFGLTARHVKTSMSMEASPDACMKQNMKVETDGWYVDLPEFSCPMSHPQAELIPTNPGAGSGCRDKMIFKTSGTGKLGFPLTETRKMTMEDAEMTFTQTVETLEFSKATLDGGLFDIPNGYQLAANSQDLYGKPDMAAMMRGMNQNKSDDDDKPSLPKNDPVSTMNNSTPPAEKKAGMIRIGVYAPTNKSGENVSITNLQTFLIQKLTGGRVEAVGISSDADARSVNCDYVLTSDFSKLKQSTASKVGGMFGKITNTDTSSTRNYDTQIDFKLMPLGTGGQTMQNKAVSKTQSDVDKSAEEALSLEAEQILSKIRN